ncbi:uncharacterized protein MONBRDRAFT_34389 [Monosiga brevicollis MX1]|uniref:Uncharacterized protein n=1 Tax=Monosiga brevicollis TaxID=81824 RepID=A9VBD3_MONBE|nr:uncharacterized protein MONBRDRAFT_34389 [Monosiga brevicollis MX1]EDQ85167.1 predicted protein [Monosiga brevicollis MX1]|eukprot:XP_001749992.1 hypothetical protein [Monosiga brevicollis MX1]
MAVRYELQLVSSNGGNYIAGDMVQGQLIAKFTRNITVDSMQIRIVSQVRGKSGGNSNKFQDIVSSPTTTLLSAQQSFSKGQSHQFQFAIALPQNVPSNLNVDYMGEARTCLQVIVKEKKRQTVDDVPLNVQSGYTGSWPPPPLEFQERKEVLGSGSIFSSAKNLGLCDLSVVVPSQLVRSTTGTASVRFHVGNPANLSRDRLRILIELSAEVTCKFGLNESKRYFVSVADYIPTLNFDPSTSTFTGSLEYRLDGSQAPAGKSIQKPQDVSSFKVGVPILPTLIGGQNFKVVTSIHAHIVYYESFKMKAGGVITVVDEARPFAQGSAPSTPHSSTSSAPMAPPAAAAAAMAPSYEAAMQDPGKDAKAGGQPYPPQQQQPPYPSQQYPPQQPYPPQQQQQPFAPQQYPPQQQSQQYPPQQYPPQQQQASYPPQQYPPQQQAQQYPPQQYPPQQYPPQAQPTYPPAPQAATYPPLPGQGAPGPYGATPPPYSGDAAYPAAPYGAKGPYA